MRPAFRTLTAALLVAATAAPSLGAPQGAGHGRPAADGDRDSAPASQTATLDRHENLWGKLSASICVGCITAANRVAPPSYERPGATAVAEAKAEPIKTASRVAAAPRKFVQLRKRYAALHRRDRRRLAARARILRAAMHAKRRALRLAAAQRHRSVHAQAALVPAYGPGFENRVYRIPVDPPWTPGDDGRWRETILPTLVRLRRT
ncbi:hypothetical protein [Methylobacterium sp. J-076]|uniref:hypothetical protein n=1 Tax=Methylobacterium sp. J-076 TaxID=2836655 RepID=UPI001FBA3185|nr:hypothetical protein [Methylobacterium sp. J-076]MCJ2015430.1 hypothetical protein [Methylobacterium sp. J-076]